eukprot:scaffold42779_cov191-Amphora_coffeaeformis.AAC.6
MALPKESGKSRVKASAVYNAEETVTGDRRSARLLVHARPRAVNLLHVPVVAVCRLSAREYIMLARNNNNADTLSRRLTESEEGRDDNCEREYA